MKRIWFFALLAALLLTGCGQQRDKHPEWPEEWMRAGDHLAAETPEGFVLSEYNDAFAPNGIWYVTWVCGAERDVSNAEGEEAVAYEAQLYLLLQECRSAADAEKAVESWIARESTTYETAQAADADVNSQRFARLELLSGSAENPYSHGAAAFGVRGSSAISVELLCAEGFEGEPQELLEQFLSGLHYGD